MLEHIRTSTGYHVLLHIPFHTWTHSHFYWILCYTKYTFPYLNTFAFLLNITLYRIYLSILQHIRTSTEYHALLDIPFHTWIHSHFYWIYLSMLEHIRTSTGYHFLLDIPFHTWTHSYFYWIPFSTGYTLPYLNTFAQKYLDIPIKGVSRGLGGKGGLRGSCITFLESLGGMPGFCYRYH